MGISGHASWRGTTLARSFLFAVVLFAMLVASAGAHANLVRSEPAANAVLATPPKELRLWFSENPELRFSFVQVLDRFGRPLEGVGKPQRGDDSGVLLSVSLPPLAPGIYTVSWRVSSVVDGHPTAGSFAFGVGQDLAPGQALRSSASPSALNVGTPTPTGTVSRWLTYLGIAMLAGGFAFFPFVLGPALISETAGASRNSARAGRAKEPPADTGALVKGLVFAGELQRFLAVGLLLAVTATLTAALVQAASAGAGAAATSLGADLATLLFATRYGFLFWLRSGLLLLLGALLLQGRWRVRHAQELAAWWWWAGLALAALALLTVSLGSHAAAGPAPVAGVAADWFHLLAASIWVGGLIALLVLLVRSRQALAAMPTPLTAGLVSYFSQVATVCVVALSLMGLYRALDEVGAWQNLFDTTYGTALLIKLGLVVPLLGLAAINLLLIQRKLAHASRNAAADPASRPWHSRLRVVVGGEILLVSAVLLVTGVLTGLPPARDAYGGGVTQRAQTADLQVVFVASPGEVGVNGFRVYLHDRGGQPVTDAEKVALLFTSASLPGRTQEAVTTNMGDGSYFVQGAYLSTPGKWQAQVLVRRPGKDDERLTFTLQPRQPAAD